MSEKNFYITTPIYYPSGKLHIVFCLTQPPSDVLARYKRPYGLRCLYLTGLMSMYRKSSKAEEAGITPQAYVDGMAVGVKELYLILSYDKFIRTTDDYHEK